MRPIAALIIAALFGIADAKQTPPPRSVTPPAGWTIDEAQSQALGAKLRAVSHFGLTSPAMVDVDVYVPPRPGLVLSVATVVARAEGERDAAARVAVDELHATSQRAALAGSGIVEEGWQEKLDTANKQIEATLAWRDTAAKTRSTARLLVAADSNGNLIAITGECFAGDDADAKLVAECQSALATLQLGLPVDKRVDLALAPTGTRPTPPPGAGTSGTPAVMTDASRTPLPPMTIPQKRPTTDRRPVYVGLGLVVLAALFYWNRRRRAHLEDPSDER